MTNNKKEGLFILFGGLFLILLVILMNSFDIKLFCIFNHLTGLLCPGCGTTRMLKSLFRLKIKDAFMFNPLVFCLLPFIVIYFFDRLLILLFNKKRSGFYELYNDKNRAGYSFGEGEQWS